MKVLHAEHALYMVRVDKGEEIVEALLRFAREQAVVSGAVTGLGGVDQVRLAYFDPVEKAYLPLDLDGVLELVSLTGNLAREAEAPFLHAHVVVSDRECRCTGGHLLRARVAVTAEFAVRVGERPIFREFDPELGVKRQRF